MVWKKKVCAYHWINFLNAQVDWDFFFRKTIELPEEVRFAFYFPSFRDWRGMTWQTPSIHHLSTGEGWLILSRIRQLVQTGPYLQDLRTLNHFSWKNLLQGTGSNSACRSTAQPMGNFEYQGFASCPQDLLWLWLYPDNEAIVPNV